MKHEGVHTCDGSCLKKLKGHKIFTTSNNLKVLLLSRGSDKQ